MHCRSRWTSYLMLLAGGLAGWTAASGRLDFPRSASASVDPKPPAIVLPAESVPVQAAAAERPTCDSGADRNGLLALHNQAGAAKTDQKKKPNILVIFGDDVGYGNLSSFNNGVMGYDTPNIDRLARQGGKLVTYYAQQSCTAGRSAFITGQMPFRTGLSKVGLPGAKLGLQKEDPTIAEMLKPLGYATGQFGKNHLGDRDEFLPTAHGFDEFFGNLYHLNAEEEPENSDYPKDPEFRKKYGPRGVIHSTSDGKITDTGPLSQKRMETIDEEVLAKATDFIDRTQKADKPFFVWFNTTRMHNYTHVKPEHLGKTGLGFYADGMVEHDAIIGQLLDYVSKAGLDENTIVIYTTDNGPMTCMFPDGGSTPFRSEKNTNWDGGWRVPALIRWPGVVKPGTVYKELVSSEDWFPTLLAAAGNADVKNQLLKGTTAGEKTFKVHLDGFDQTDYLSGKSEKSARKGFFYFSDDGDLLAVRGDRVKAHFMIQEAKGIDVWRRPFVKLRAPMIFDLKIDPYEKSDDGVGYDDWFYHRAYVLVPVQDAVGQMLSTFKEFPPRQKPSSFTVGDALDALTVPSGGK